MCCSLHPKHLLLLASRKDVIAHIVLRNAKHALSISESRLVWSGGLGAPLFLACQQICAGHWQGFWCGGQRETWPGPFRQQVGAKFLSLLQGRCWARGCAGQLGLPAGHSLGTYVQ